MLLGGSQSQLSAARMIKALGHRLILADYLENPPAAALSDVHVRASTFDADACVRAAKAHRVDGVVTTGTDQPVYTAAVVSKALGLKYPISVETAKKATNKRAMKEAFRAYGVPHVPYAYLSGGQGAGALDALTPPLVMKPLDAQGQRGVFKLGSPEEALCRLGETLSFSREDSALVERYYPSDEVTLSAFVAGGRVHPLTLTDRQHMSDPLHIGVCAAHRYPSIHAGRMAEVQTIAERVALALGVKEGPLYIQLLIGDEGVVVNEAACRVGGAYEDVFIPYVTGFDILRQVIGLSLGEKADLSALRSPLGRGDGCQVSEQMLFCRPGKIASITGLESILALPGVLAAGYNFAPGSVLPAMENATARFGYCVLATDKGDMAGKVRALYEVLRVLNPEGENLVIPRTYDG